MPSLVEKIAAQIAAKLPGIDWESLEQQFGMPREELVYHNDVTRPPDDTGIFAYDKSIRFALARADIQMSKISLSYQVTDSPDTIDNEVSLAMRAWDRVQASAVDVGDLALKSIKLGFRDIYDEKEAIVKVEDYRAIITSTYLTCLYGALIHFKKLMQFEDFDSLVIVDHADTIVRTLNALSTLGEMEALSVLAPQATGAAPVVMTVIAISSAFVIGVICYAAVSMQEVSRYNDLVEVVCQEAIKTGDAAAVARCGDLIKLNKAGVVGPVVSTAKSLADATNTIAIALIALMVTPTVISFFRKKKTSP